MSSFLGKQMSGGCRTDTDNLAFFYFYNFHHFLTFYFADPMLHFYYCLFALWSRMCRAFLEANPTSSPVYMWMKKLTYSRLAGWPDDTPTRDIPYIHSSIVLFILFSTNHQNFCHLSLHHPKSPFSSTSYLLIYLL